MAREGLGGGSQGQGGPTVKFPVGGGLTGSSCWPECVPSVPRESYGACTQGLPGRWGAGVWRLQRLLTCTP